MNSLLLGAVEPEGEAAWEGLPAWLVPGARFLATAPPRRPDLIEGLLPTGALVLLSGPGGSGKTLLTLEMIGAVLTGSPAFGRFRATRGRCVLLEQEHWPDTLAERLRRAGVASPDLLIGHRTDFRLDEPAKVDEFARFLQANSVALVVLDPMINFHRKNENDAQDMAPVLEAFERLQHASPDTTFLVLHHVTKSPRGSGPSYRGSTRIGGSFDVLLEVAPLREGNGTLEVVLSCQKSKDDRRLPDQQITIRFGPHLSWEIKDATAVQAAPPSLRDRVIAALQQAVTFPSKGAVVDAVEGNRKAVFDILDQLQAEGLVEWVKVGRGTGVRWTGK